MTTSPLLHRTLAVLASGGAAAALTLIPYSAAHAQVSANFEAVGEASARYTGSVSGGDCTLTSGSDSVTSTPVAFHHGTKTRSVKLNATFTNNQNSGDTVQVKGKVNSSLTMKRKGGDLSSLDLAAGGSITFSHSIIGSECSPSGEMFGAIPLAKFTEHKKGTLTLTYNASQAGALVEFVVVNQVNGAAVVVAADVGTHMKGSATATLKPGKYEIGETEVGIIAGSIFAKRAQPIQKTKLNVGAQLTFQPAKH